MSVCSIFSLPRCPWHWMSRSVTVKTSAPSGASPSGLPHFPPGTTPEQVQSRLVRCGLACSAVTAGGSVAQSGRQGAAWAIGPQPTASVPQRSTCHCTSGPMAHRHDGAPAQVPLAVLHCGPAHSQQHTRGAACWCRRGGAADVRLHVGAQPKKNFKTPPKMRRHRSA